MPFIINCMSGYYSILLLSIVIFLANCTLWPIPKSYTYNATAQPIIISPCDLKYNIDSPLLAYVSQHLEFYFSSVFRCGSKGVSNISLAIVVRSSNMTLPTQTNAQSYTLLIRQSGRWELSADYFIGFLRGFETYSQLFNKEGDSYTLSGIPIAIDDVPAFKWRGVMIDSSRHFLPIEDVKKTINGLLFNKMNILHWHIIDQDSFPMQVPKVPQLSQAGMIGGSYTPDQLKDVVAYAKLKGVRVVVEIDTPAHTHSWGRSNKFKENVVRCNDLYTGQFDPTLDSTYELVGQVLKFANSIFEDSYIHFGGDEVSTICWDLKPSILKWMAQHGIASYRDLQVHYRSKQKSLWRGISLKKVIYWTNEQLNLPVEKDDVIHWWGESRNLDRLSGRSNEVILSNFDLAYIDKGFGNRNGFPYGSLINWREIYGFNPKIAGVNVIGGETCMWSELSNRHTHEQKIWIRSSVMGERLWNDQINIKTQLGNIAERLTGQANRMRERGFKISPVTVQICEEDTSICFDRK